MKRTPSGRDKLRAGRLQTVGKEGMRMSNALAANGSRAMRVVRRLPSAWLGIGAGVPWAR